MGNLSDYFAEHPELGAGTLPSDSKPVELIEATQFISSIGDTTVALDSDDANEVE